MTRLINDTSKTNLEQKDIKLVSFVNNDDEFVWHVSTRIKNNIWHQAGNAVDVHWKLHIYITVCQGGVLTL